MTMRIAPLLVSALGACCACSSDEVLVHDLTIQAGVSWNNYPASSVDAGLFVDIKVLVMDLPPGTRENCDLKDLAVTIGGLSASQSKGCLTWSVGPFFGNDPVSVGINYRGDAASATFANLFQGWASQLVEPSDGNVKAGQDIVVVPAQPFVAAEFSEARIVWFDMASQPFGTSHFVTTDAAGVHVAIPTDGIGRALLRIGGATPREATVESCQGLRRCIAYGTSDLGPFRIAVSP